MTPGARIAAAIEVLDAQAGGLAAEQALTRWGRQSRYAGSKDRAAVRDHVYDVLRCRQSVQRFGGGETGRALMIGLLRQQGLAPETFFTGQGYAPDPLTEAEAAQADTADAASEDWNIPDWLMSEFCRSLGDDAQTTALELQRRAPVTLRVNLFKTTTAQAQAALADEGIQTHPNMLAETALSVDAGARKIRNAQSYLNGWVELQDAASQAMILAVPPGRRCLDLCAGGGGKALALAADADREIFAHDVDLRRMRDLPIRAARAGVRIRQVETECLQGLGPYDVVVADVPCSGSGAWRRTPEGKWSLSPAMLSELQETQGRILDQAAQLTATDGVIVYATCSVLRCENEEQIAAFVARNSEWSCTFQRRFDVTTQSDGFYTAHLTRV